MGWLVFLLIIILIVVVKVAVFAVVFRDEVAATQEKDPASPNYLQIILLYSGLHALIMHRIAHWLWKRGFHFIARAYSQLGRFLTGIEIHPGAQIGKGLFIDHGMGVVIGETTIIGDNVTLFQGVTLGGTGKETGKRHPTIESNVVIGAGAKVLGNIIIGENSYVGANAVVIKSVPQNATVVGVPGRITRQDGKKIDTALDHIHTFDPVMQQMSQLKKRIKDLEDNKQSEPEDE